MVPRNRSLLDTLPSIVSSGIVNVVIDTPKESRHKYKFDERWNCFKLSRILPAGAMFPYDFGSIPRTLAEDGDALDVLILSDAPTFVGCVLSGKVIGILMGEQTQDEKVIRNDRLLAVPVTPVNPVETSHIEELPPSVLNEIEHFFRSYNLAHGRTFTTLGRGGPDRAMKALAAAQRRYTRKHKR